MQVKDVTLEKEEKFEPIKLEITIESEEELVSLWARLNMSVSSVQNNYPNRDVSNIAGTLRGFWAVMDEYMCQLKLKLKNLEK